MTYNRIAYEALDVCNALTMEAVVEAVAKAGLRPGDRAIDIGSGNAAVAIRLSQEFGLAVDAVERDPLMAELAAQRIAKAGASGVTLRVTGSAEVLTATPPVQLIIVIGATDAAAPGLRDPVAVFARLAEHLIPGGCLLWGEPFWTAEPSAPFRQLIAVTNDYQTHEGWQEAARAAGLEVVSTHISDPATEAHYLNTMDSAVRAWAAAHPDAPVSPGLIAHADRVKILFEMEGSRVLGFGLYLFRKPG